MTQPTSGRAACTALWMVKPAALMGYVASPTMCPSRSTLNRLDAVTSSKARAEVWIRSGHARRDVVEEELVPAVALRQSIAGGELDPDLALLLADRRIGE